MTQDPGTRNVEKLLEHAEPVRMPEAVRARIRARLGEKQRPSSRRLPAWAAAAPLLLVALVVFLWPGDPQSGVSWADVLDRLESVRTVVAKSDTTVSSETGASVEYGAKIYFKDPGLSRTEITTPRESIVIIRRAPDRAEQLTLDPESKRAHHVTHFFRSPGSAAPPRPTIDMVSESWRRLSRIASTVTRNVGEREIDGHAVVGFEIPAAEMFEDFAALNEGTLRVWAERDTALPVLVELEFLDEAGARTSTSLSRIEWDVPLEDDLFDLSVPSEWGLRRSRREVVVYTATSLAPHVALRIGPEDGNEIVSETDVVAVRRGESVEHSGTEEPGSTRITLELTLAAAKRFRSFVEQFSGETLIADFNGEAIVIPKLDDEKTELIELDLSRLGKSLADLEDEYFTPPLRFEVRLLSDGRQDGWAAAPDPFGSRQVYLSPDVALSNADIARAWYDPDGEEHRVGLLLTEEGAVKFAKLTKRHIGERLALIVDGRILSAPVIAGEISGGRALIQGNLTEDEARAVVKGLDPRDGPSEER